MIYKVTTFRTIPLHISTAKDLSYSAPQRRKVTILAYKTTSNCCRCVLRPLDMCHIGNKHVATFSSTNNSDFFTLRRYLSTANVGLETATSQEITSSGCQIERQPTVNHAFSSFLACYTFVAQAKALILYSFL